MSPNRPSHLLLAAAALTLLPVPAAAADKARAVNVRYGDLDLSKPADRAKLERRVKSAARGLCSFRGHPPAREVELSSACTRETMARTLRKIDMAVVDQASAQASGGGGAQMIEVSRS